MRFEKTFNLHDTLEQAMAEAERFNAAHHGWKKHQAGVTPWESLDGRQKKFICWSWR